MFNSGWPLALSDGDWDGGMSPVSKLPRLHPKWVSGGVPPPSLQDCTFAAESRSLDQVRWEKKTKPQNVRFQHWFRSSAPDAGTNHIQYYWERSSGKQEAAAKQRHWSRGQIIWPLLPTFCRMLWRCARRSPPKRFLLWVSHIVYQELLWCLVTLIRV